MTTADCNSQVMGTNRRSRWSIAGLLFVITIINYADRGVLGVVAPVLMKTFGLSIRQFGIIASGFGWGYVVMLFLSGGVVSLLGPKKTYMYFSVLWSLAIMLVGIASGFASLLLLRILFGASEGVVFPSGSQLIGNWFPGEEHGRAASLMFAGIPLGSLVIIPIAVWLTEKYSWQAPFIVLGIAGIIWAIACKIFITNRPEGEVRPVVPGTMGETESASPVPWGRILHSKTLWLTGLAFFSSAYVLYFLLNFLPTYLIKEKHLEFSHLSYFATLPWIFMTLGALLSGVTSDFIFKKTRSLRWGRSYLAGACLVLTGLIIGLTLFVTDTLLIVVLISVASFINFLANPVFFAIPIDACPEHSGIASSLTTGIGSLAGVVAPLLTGIIVSETGNFSFAFVLVASLPIVFGILLVAACKPEQL